MTRDEAHRRAIEAAARKFAEGLWNTDYSWKEILPETETAIAAYLDVVKAENESQRHFNLALEVLAADENEAPNPTFSDRLIGLVSVLFIVVGVFFVYAGVVAFYYGIYCAMENIF